MFVQASNCNEGTSFQDRQQSFKKDQCCFAFWIHFLWQKIHDSPEAADVYNHAQLFYTHIFTAFCLIKLFNLNLYSKKLLKQPKHLDDCIPNSVMTESILLVAFAGFRLKAANR